MEYRMIIILLLNYKLSSVDSSVVKDPSKETQYCQQRSYVNIPYECVKKCSASFGLFDHENKFVCTENKVMEIGVSKYREPAGFLRCECAHPVIKVIDCFPKIFHGFRTFEECNDICGNYLVLTFVRNNERKAYCDVARIDFKLYDLEAITLSGYKENEITGEFYIKKICKCGINMNREVEKKLMKIENMEKRGRKNSRKNPNKLLHFCRMQEFPSTKQNCKGKCGEAKAFLNSENELICYHNRASTYKVSSTKEDCQCGAIINKRNHIREKKTLKCYPEKTYPAIAAMKCNGFCREVISAYFFLWHPNQSEAYCDSELQHSEGIKGLDFHTESWAKGNTSINTNNDELFSCKCGLPLSQMKELSENKAVYSGSSGGTKYRKIGTEVNRNNSTFSSVANQMSSQNFVRSDSSLPAEGSTIIPLVSRTAKKASSSPDLPNQSIWKNSNARASSSEDRSNRRNTRIVSNDEIANSNTSQELLEDDSFINSLDRLPFDVPEIHSIGNIPSIDCIPAKDVQVPLLVGQLPESTFRTDTNASSIGTTTLARRDSFSNERASFPPADTNDTPHDYDKDVFANVLNDDLINYPPLFDGQPNPLFTSNYVPVADLNIPPRFDDYSFDFY